MLRSFGRGLRHDLGHGGDLAEQRADQSWAAYTSVRTIGELHLDDVAAHECLTATGRLDRPAYSNCQARTSPEVVRCEDVDRRIATRVAVCDAVSVRDQLIEASGGQCLMHSGKAGGFHPQIDDHVDVIGGPRIRRTSLGLEQEDHLSANQ